MKGKEIIKTSGQCSIINASREPLGSVNITTYKPVVDGNQITIPKFKVVDGSTIYTIDKKTFTITKDNCFIVIEKRKLILNNTGGLLVLSCLYLDNQGEVKGWTR